MSWTREEAILLCTLLEQVAPSYGCHVGLTGGLLYKSGERKDLDVLLYRIRDTPVDWKGLYVKFHDFGIEIESDFGFCTKANLNGKRIDFLRPEVEGGDYQRRLAESGAPLIDFPSC